MINDLIISELEHFRKQKIKERNYILLIFNLISIIIIVTIIFSNNQSSLPCISIITYMTIFIIIVLFFQNQYSKQVKKLLINIMSQIPNFEEFKIIKYFPEKTDFLKTPLLTLYPEASIYTEEDYFEIEYNHKIITFTEVEISKVKYKNKPQITYSYTFGKKRRRIRDTKAEIITLYKGIVITLPSEIFNSSSANIMEIQYTSIPNFTDKIFIFYPSELYNRNYFEFNLQKQITKEYINDRISQIIRILSIIKEITKNH
ncbi:MAG: hypothetical protein N2169_05350 [bacterium]|nr:hypothetical protein [bacterium]